MEIHSGLSELSVLSQVSAVEGCPLSGVPVAGKATPIISTNYRITMTMFA